MQFILLFKLNIYLIADMFTSSGMPSLLIDSAMNEGAMIFFELHFRLLSWFLRLRMYSVCPQLILFIPEINWRRNADLDEVYFVDSSNEPLNWSFLSLSSALP